MKARNIMEEIVAGHLKQMISSGSKVCCCSDCRAKIIADVLSNLPAKYITSETGAMHAMIEQVRVEQAAVILKEIIKAIKKLKPHQ